MFVAKLSIVIFALLALQGSTYASTQNELAVRRQGEESLKQLKLVIDKAILEGKERVDVAVNELTSRADALIYGIQTKLRAELEKLLKEVQDIQDKAIQIGIDAVECYHESLDELKEITEQFIRDAIKCIRGQVDRAMDFARSVYHDLEDIIDLYKNIVTKWNSCNGDVGCYMGIITEVGLSLVRIPIVAYYKSYEGATLVVSMAKNLMLCEAKVILEMAANSGNELATIATCLANKIHLDESKTPRLLF